MGNVPACCASDSTADAPLRPGSTAVGIAASERTAELGVSSRPVGQWNVAEVEVWVLAIGLPREVAAAFRDAEIEGDSLLSLTREEIEQDVGIRKVGHRKRLFKALDELKQARIDSTSQPAATRYGGGNGRHLAQLGDAAEEFASRFKAQRPPGPAQLGSDVVASAQGRGSLEETSPLTRTARGFGLSVMESAPSRDDAVVVEGGFCATVPVGSKVVRVNGVAVRSVDDIRTLLAEVPVGGSAEIGYHTPP